MDDLIVYALREDYADFSGGSVSIGDGEEYDVFEALEAGGGRIVLGVTPRENADGDVTETEAIRSLRDAYISEVLKNYLALERVDAEDGDEPASYGDVDVTLGSGPTKSELRERANELDIVGRSSMDKDELAAAIAETEAALAAGTPVTTDPDPDATEDNSPNAEGTTEGSVL